jgi:hypothetical protein
MQGKNGSGKTLKSSLKAVTTSAILAGNLLISPPSSATAREATDRSILERVETVRSQLQEKLAADTNAIGKLSYSEMELAQWGNWGNWGNWNNWANWANWNNWNNWANWGNWRNW